MSEPIRYPLKHPVTITLRGPDGDRQETISELTLRRVKGKDMRALDGQGGEVAKTLALIAHISGHPLTIVDELDAEDIGGIGDLLQDFFPASLGTGPMSSET